MEEAVAVRSKTRASFIFAVGSCRWQLEYETDVQGGLKRRLMSSRIIAYWVFKVAPLPDLILTKDRYSLNTTIHDLGKCFNILQQTDSFGWRGYFVNIFYKIALDIEQHADAFQLLKNLITNQMCQFELTCLTSSCQALTTWLV